MNKQKLFTAIALLVAVTAYWFWSNGSSDNKVASGKPIVQVSVPDLQGVAKAGEPLFNENCASCHGTNAAGQDGVAPPLIHKIYEPNHHGDQAFILAAKNGVRGHHWPFGNMPPVEGTTKRDITKIIAYVRALQRANGIY